MSDNVKKPASASAAEPLEPEIGRLLQPTRFFRHPRDVTRDATLTTAIEASFSNRFGWYARAGAEWLVYCIVRFDDVIDALRELDGKPDSVEGIRRRRRDRRRGGDSEDGPTGRGNWF